jgi:hypothetical protein
VNRNPRSLRSFRGFFVFGTTSITINSDASAESLGAFKVVETVPGFAGFLARARAVPKKPTLIFAGATGVLGNEVLRRVAGSGRYGQVHVLAREPVRTIISGVALQCMPEDVVEQWPLLTADIGVVMFEPARMFYERERALWVPKASQIEPLARWMRLCGVNTLLVVMPYAQGTLPVAVAHGFASLSEQAVSAMGFDTVVWLRSAQKATPEPAKSMALKARDLVLSVFSYMMPASEQPLRASQIAQAVSSALVAAPTGLHVITHKMIWEAGQSGTTMPVDRWFTAP